jgi:hypothetical protein
LDSVLTGSTLRHDSNGISAQAPLSHTDLAFFEDEFEFSQEPTVFGHAPIQSAVHQQLLDDFVLAFPNNHCSSWLDPSQFNHDPSSSWPISNSTTAVDSPSPQDATEICYGTVSRTAVRLAGDMLQLDHRLQRTDASYGFGFTGFKVRPGKQDFTLHFVDGTHFGSTNTQFSNGLEGICPMFPIRMEAIANTANVRDRITRAKKISDAIIRVDVNVFGPRKDTAAVGKMLSDAKLWLQKPDFLKNVAYENPQFLKLEGFEYQEAEQKPLEASSQTRLVRGDDKFKEMVEDVFNKLTRSDQLQRVEKDQRVKTELLQ